MNTVKDLKQYSYRLYLTLLKEHIDASSLIPTAKEEDCVKAFCVLTHAALEEYFEAMTLNTINTAYTKFKAKNFIKAIPVDQNEIDKINSHINQLIKTLVLSSSFSVYSKSNSETLKDHKSKLEKVTQLYKTGNNLTVQELSELTKKCESYTKEILKETRKFFDSHIESNHGASLKYLLKLLVPVGIDIPESLLLNSLQKVAEYRGKYAHSQGNLNQIISASDIAKYFIDIMKLCSVIEISIKDYHEYMKP